MARLYPIFLALLFAACTNTPPSEPAPPPAPPATAENTFKLDVVPDPVPDPLAGELGDLVYEASAVETPTGRVILQNGYPRGGAFLEDDAGLGYTSPDAGFYGYGILWTRVVNESEQTVTLDLQFPKDSLVLSTPENYFKYFLMPDEMELGDAMRFNYGLEEPIAFLDAHFYKATSLKRTLQPGESTMFNTLLLTHTEDNGAIRCALRQTPEGLQYHSDVSPFGSFDFLCGSLEISD